MKSSEPRPSQPWTWLIGAGKKTIEKADMVGRYLEAIQELTGKIDNQQLVDMCSRVIELEPEIGDGYLARVIAGLELGIDDNLKSDTNTLLRLWPDDADAMAYGSDAYMVLVEFERAKMLLDRLIEHNPEVYGFLIQHGRALFELGEIQRAKAELELAIENLAGDDHCVSMCYIKLARIAEREPPLQEVNRSLVSLPARSWKSSSSWP